MIFCNLAVIKINLRPSERQEHGIPNLRKALAVSGNLSDVSLNRTINEQNFCRSSLGYNVARSFCNLPNRHSTHHYLRFACKSKLCGCGDFTLLNDTIVCNILLQRLYRRQKPSKTNFEIGRC